MKSKMKLIAALRFWFVFSHSLRLFMYFFRATLSSLPVYQRTFLLTINLVPWMVFAGLPLVEMVVNRITGIVRRKE